MSVFGRPICDHSWTNKNAEVVCKSLNFPPGTFAIGWGNEQVSTNFFMDDVVCNGGETNLKQCEHKTHHNCGSSNGAAVVCLETAKIKLVPSNSGNSKNEGSIVFEDIPICATNWDLNAAQVACNHLYGEEFKIPVPVFSYQKTDIMKNAPLFLTSVICNGKEKLLTQCQLSIAKSCTSSIASVQCAKCSPYKLMAIVKRIKVDGSINEVYQSTLAAISELTAECRNWVCNVSNPVYPDFCKVKAFLNSVKNFAKPERNNSIILYRDVDHFGLLNYNFLKGNFETIRSDIDSLGQTFSTQLGEYFSRLSQFDKLMAKSHKEYALKVWLESKTRCESLSFNFANLLAEIMRNAFGVSKADYASKTLVLAYRVAGAMNLMKWIIEGDSSAVDIKEALSEVAKQRLLIEQIKYIELNTIPKLSNLIRKISAKVNANKNTFESIRRFLETIEQNKEFTKEQLDNFVEHYDKYSPAISAADVSEYGAIISEMLEKLCEVIENPDTEIGVLEATDAVTKGLCPNAKETAAVLVALYQEIASQETAIMDSFSKFVRATIAEDAANKLSNSMKGSSSDQLQSLLTKYEALHLIRYHKLIIIKNACNYLTYMNHGVEKPVCTELLENPSGDPGTLINTVPVDMCKCPNCFTKKGEFLIPATMTGENDTIDLSTLYNPGTEFTKGFAYLNIPNKGWLVGNRWISEYDQGPFFLKNLNIHLPPAFNFSQETNIKLTLLENQLGGKSYMFEGGVLITNQYTENHSKCSQPNPYTFESCSKKFGAFCLNIEGKIQGRLLPRLDGSKWRIELRSDHILPKIYSATKLFLRAAAEFCFQHKLLSRPKLELTVSDEPQFEECCSNNGMFTDQILLKKSPNLNFCQVCPEASSPRLSGYFCEKCPPGYEPNTSNNFGCTPCPKNKFKSTSGQQACESCLDGKKSSEGATYCY